MTKTTNYQLNQWEPTDKISRADFNADNAKIDAVLAGMAERINGGCRIATGSYVGDGTYGPDNPTSLTFDFYPLMVVIGIQPEEDTGEPEVLKPSIMLRAVHAASSTNSSALYVMWSDKKVSWYCSEDVLGPSSSQNNTKKRTFWWVAIGTVE